MDFVAHLTAEVAGARLVWLELLSVKWYNTLLEEFPLIIIDLNELNFRFLNYIYINERFTFNNLCEKDNL